MKYELTEMKMRKILGTCDISEQMSVGLIGVDNNFRWERLKDMIKLCGFCKGE